MRSVERRVTYASLLTTTGLLVALGLIVLVGVRLVLVGQLDRGLREQARLIAAMAVFDDGDLELEFDGLEPAEPFPGVEPLLLQVWDGDRARYRSSVLGKGDLPSPGYAATIAFGWARSPVNGARIRCVSLGFAPRVEGRVVEGRPVPELRLTLARDAGSVGEVVSGLAGLLLISGGVLGAGAWLLSRRVARSGLSSLRGFAARIAELDGRRLRERLDLSEVPEEVVPVGERLNELLGDLEATLERERSLSADIAHELRTPLAGIRSTLEVALAGEPHAEDDRRALLEAQESALTLQKLVDRLLWLVRLDSGTAEIEIQTVDVVEILGPLVKQLAPEAAARNLCVEWEDPGSVEAATDPMLTGIALRNLLENAVAYADAGGRVSVRVLLGDGAPAVAIENTGSQVDPADLPLLLRRFTRGDVARSWVGARCGLGLPLVSRIADALGHELCIRTTPGGTFRAEFRFGR